MKKIVIGCVGVLSSMVLFGMTLVSAAIYSLYVTSGGPGWGSSGPFWTAFGDIATIPAILVAVLFAAGILFLVSGFGDKS